MLSNKLLILLLFGVGCVVATVDWTILANQIDGAVLLPGNQEYHDIRDQVLTINAEVPDDQPLAIVQPKNAVDVSKTIQFANSNSIPQVTALAGGHNGDGFAFPLDGIQLQFKFMAEIQVDSINQIASIQPGVLVGNVTQALEPYGLGHAIGNCNIIGNTGFLSVGGFGFWTRVEGMGVDTVVEYELVTATGSIVTANAVQNSDLFFALRGALPAYGIATKITFRTFNTSDFYGGYLWYRFPTPEIAKLAMFDWFNTILNTPDLIDNRYFQTRLSPFNRFSTSITVLYEIIFLGPDSVQTKKDKLAPLVNITGFNGTVDFYPQYLDAQQPFPVFLPITYHEYNLFNFESNLIRWQLPFLNNLQNYQRHGMMSESRIKTPGVLADLMDDYWRGYNYSEPSTFNQIGEVALSGFRVAEIPRNENAFYSRDFWFLWGYGLAYATDAELAAARAYYDPFIHRMITLSENRGFYGNYNSIRNNNKYDSLGTNLPKLEKIKKDWDPNNTFSRSWSISPGVGSECVDIVEAELDIEDDRLKLDAELDQMIDIGDLTFDSYVSLALYDCDYNELALFDFEWWSGNWEAKFNSNGDVKKWKYRDGKSKVVIKEVDDDDPRFKFDLRDDEFAMPDLPMPIPVYLRIELGTGVCLQATFVSGDVEDNDDDDFDAEFDD